jgi:poly(3-hydroxyalkanoate) synthetase
MRSALSIQASKSSEYSPATKTGKKQIFKLLKLKEMKEEIRQDGRTILSSEDGFSIRMFFNNLSGKNFSGNEYWDYVRNIAFGEMGFIPGTIELYCDGKKVRTGTLPEL